MRHSRFSISVSPPAPGTACRSRPSCVHRHGRISWRRCGQARQPDPPWRRQAFQAGRLCSARQGGQGAVEFLLAAAPVLLLGLSSLEALHWYFARQAVSLALTQAARAAITLHADPAVLDTAFAEALLPLHAGPTPAASRARLAKATHQREHTTGLPAWRIRIVSPSSAAFADFAASQPDLPSAAGRPVIDNDYLHEQHLARLAQGWPQGRGPQSGQTTLEANSLALHLTWLHEPLLPGMKQLLKQLAPSDARYGSQAMSRAGYLPMHRQVVLVMQSHPIEWDMPAHGRIVRLPFPDAVHAPPAPAGTGSHAGGPPSTAQNGAQTPACSGLWCLNDYREASSPEQDDETGNPQVHPGSGGHPPAQNGQSPGSGSDDAYRDVGSDAVPAGPEDCPGCCD